MSYACAAGDAASLPQALLLSPSALSPPKRCWVDEKSRTSSQGWGTLQGWGEQARGKQCC